MRHSKFVYGTSFAMLVLVTTASSCPEKKAPCICRSGGSVIEDFNRTESECEFQSEQIADAPFFGSCTWTGSSRNPTEPVASPAPVPSEQETASKIRIIQTTPEESRE